MEKEAEEFGDMVILDVSGAIPSFCSVWGGKEICAGKWRGVVGVRKDDADTEEMDAKQMVDNIDFGKTHKYFQWIAKEYAGEGRVKGRPRFVM